MFYDGNLGTQYIGNPQNLHNFLEEGSKNLWKSHSMSIILPTSKNFFNKQIMLYDVCWNIGVNFAHLWNIDRFVTLSKIKGIRSLLDRFAPNLESLILDIYFLLSWFCFFKYLCIVSFCYKKSNSIIITYTIFHNVFCCWWLLCYWRTAYVFRSWFSRRNQEVGQILYDYDPSMKSNFDHIRDQILTGQEIQPWKL